MTDALEQSMGRQALDPARWRQGLGFVGPYGPPPRLATVTRRIYEATALLLGGSALVAALRALVAPQRSGLSHGWVLPGFIGSIAALYLATYAYGLARAVARLASPGSRPTGVVACAPLIAHGLAGLLGALALLLHPLAARHSAPEDALDGILIIAAVAFAGGWIIVIPTAYWLDRGERLVLCALAGPLGVFVLALLFGLTNLVG